MEIKDVFGAQPKSVWEYLCENGQGLYVPAYQRQYSWDRSKITRLFEDACHGFSMLLDHEDSITFLGTIIAIHDTQYLTVNPLVKGDVPSRVMTIIDGQQRLTTLLLINTILHEEIRLRHPRINSQIEAADQWLEEECMKALGRLAKTFEEDKDYGDGAYRFYPRMIRAYDDSWSRKKDKAEYKSPIGQYLHLYGQHGRGEAAQKPFKLGASTTDSNNAKHTLLNKGRTIIQGLIRSVAKRDNPDLEIPDFESILNAPSFQNILVKADFPEAVYGALRAENNDDIKELLRLVLFANFILDRVALTIVTAKNEDYAFDMFEALNTTGEPLTAFETFKPRVIYHEGLANYEKSPSHSYINTVENYLESYGKTDDKQDATSRLIVAFALAERGEKLSKRLSEQRRFFKENYDKLSTTEEKNEFVRHLSHAAIFVQNAWPDDKNAYSSIFSASEAETDEVLLCLDFLRGLKHSITVGPLVRFYSEIRKSDPENAPKAISDFVEATKAITAFSVLWRASRRTTDNIDTHYRKLMEVGHLIVGMPPLARRPDGSNSSPPNVSLLKGALINILAEEGKISSKSEWVRATSKIPAYKNQREVTRFLLLASANDSVPDNDNPGLIMTGKREVLPLFDLKNWRDEKFQTVEHIAPKTREAGWQDEIYQEDELIDRLGNLTLLPLIENASISNASWAKKRLLYKILSSDSLDELDHLMQDARGQGIELSQDTAELMAKSKYLPMVKAIATVDSEWSMDLIERRSNRIAELAWDKISPWLFN